MASGMINTIVCNLKIFSSPTEFGLSWSNVASTTDIVRAMPNQSMLIIATTGNADGDGYPIYQEIGASGSVVIIKTTSYRAMGICIPYSRSASGNKVYFMRCKGEYEVAWSTGTEVTYNS